MIEKSANLHFFPLLLCALALALAVAACSRSEPVSSDAAAVPPVDAAAPREAASTVAESVSRPTACTLVTEAEMSAILGGAVTGQAADRPTQTECTYTAASGISPYAEIKVTWGDGEVGMIGAGLARQFEPGLTDPLSGLGDQASSMGPGFMVRTGEDLVTIVFSGVAEPVEKAKRIIGTMRPRMGPSSQRSAAGETPPGKR